MNNREQQLQNDINKYKNALGELSARVSELEIRNKSVNAALNFLQTRSFEPKGSAKEIGKSIVDIAEPIFEFLKKETPKSNIKTL